MTRTLAATIEIQVPRDATPFSLAQDLPFDVLQEIFRCYMPQKFSLGTIYRFPAFLLCHICSSWRNSFLAMKSLWTSITFPVHTIRELGPPFTLYIHPKSTRLISWWKEFLPNVPPSIYLIEPPSTRPRYSIIDVSTFDKAYTNFFCSPFFRSARSLLLNIINEDLDNICSDPTLFPNLRDLRIKIIYGSTTRRIPVSPFPPAPHLVYLYLSHCELFGKRLLCVFPWAQLTHLYIPRTIPFDCFRSLMKLTSSLELAALVLYPENPSLQLPLPAPAPVATHNVCMLRHLIISTSREPIKIWKALDSLYFPTLTALRICSGAYPMTNIAKLHKLLGIMPALEELHFDSTLSFADGHVLPFSFAPAGQTLATLVPRLRRLVIDFVDPSRNNVGANIVSFLQSAWLCKGWIVQDECGDLVRRYLELIVENHSLVKTPLISEKIIAQVKGYLESGGNFGLPFEVSIKDGYSISVTRRTYNIINEELPSRGWDRVH